MYLFYCLIMAGGSRGIGRSIALALAESGCRVIVNYSKNEIAALEVIKYVLYVSRRVPSAWRCLLLEYCWLLHLKFVPESFREKKSSFKWINIEPDVNWKCMWRVRHVMTSLSLCDWDCRFATISLPSCRTAQVPIDLSTSHDDLWEDANLFCDKGSVALTFKCNVITFTIPDLKVSRSLPIIMESQFFPLFVTI